MRVLLDTHVLLWWLLGDDRLSGARRDALANPDTEVWVSAASGWEIATKHRIGKLGLAPRVVHDLPQILAEQHFRVLEISLAHALRAGSLPGAHRDPFDRMLAAQSVLENLPIVSADDALDALGAERLAP
ncbi:MAG: type II toxin-antitoxin system VapC family toxin [Deltaproteobacteria bacterium]|nr:type II toxin-antitoxin system VapC family toxin [Deltaproteobacteria bacterium]